MKCKGSLRLGVILEGLPLLLFFYAETLCPRFLRDGGHLWLAAQPFSVILTFLQSPGSRA